MSRTTFLAACLLFSFACGSDGTTNLVSDGIGDSDGGIDSGDGGINFGDGGVADIICSGDDPPECCNGIDDDEDGFVDGADIECISPHDDDESSFATGIPGDNKDGVKQDCFFDGDSGQGNDGCNIHICCITTGCADKNFDATKDCEVSEKCAQNCGAITPPGCDCLGCCTICQGPNCYDIVVSPACSEETLDNPLKCTPCNKLDTCRPPDCATDPDPCAVCPGETLPPQCQNQSCPNGEQFCNSDQPCPDSKWCSQGCCLDGYIVQ